MGRDLLANVRTGFPFVLFFSPCFPVPKLLVELPGGLPDMSVRFDLNWFGL